MKKMLFLASTMTLMLVSCSNDTENLVPMPHEITLSANMETEVSSRTNFTPVGDFFWTKDDKIKVYTTAGSFGSFKVISGEGTASANFSGSISSSTSTCAVFPADAAGSVSGMTLTFNAPASYTYKYEQSDFATDMTPTVNSTNIPMLAKIATVGSTNLNFKNLGGVFCFKFKDVPANTCKIVFTANSKICGPFTVDLSAAEPTITTIATTNQDYKSISVGFTASTEKTNRVVYIPVPCGTYTGYEVEMFDESGKTTAFLESSKTKVIERSTALRFNEITITTINGGIENDPTPSDPYNGHEYVDLGLPSGLKWATCNVGAEKPSDYGDYFAWGDVETSESYSEDNCKWYHLFHTDLQPLGVVNAEGNLTSQYDAATVNWGENWRMPTQKEILELRNNCTWTWTNQDGHNGCLFTGANGNSIFIPAAGWHHYDDLEGAGPFDNYFDGAESFGGYWSATIKTYDGADSYCLSFGQYGVSSINNYRYYGLSIRPVTQ